MPGPTVAQELLQLQEQQSAITQCLAAMNDGRWVAAYSGPDSVEGWLLALNPTWEGELRPAAPFYAREEPRPQEPIVWKGSHNFTRGRFGMPVVAIVIHTMVGTLASCDSWFSNPKSQVSSHFGIGLNGDIHQYVRLSDSSWANGILQPDAAWPYLVGNSQNPNYQTVTIETEDNGRPATTAVSDEMYESTLQVCRLVVETFPSIVYLMGHNCISPQSRPNCPGGRWWNSGRFNALAKALSLEPCT
jgi:hypothetical protein